MVTTLERSNEGLGTRGFKFSTSENHHFIKTILFTFVKSPVLIL